MSETTIYNLDPAHSSVEFSIRHLEIANIRGTFPNISGSLETNGDDLANAKLNVTLDVRSVNTNNKMRDEHIQAADYFDTANFPNATFVSKKIETNGGDKLKVTGDFTLRGVTKEAILDVEEFTKAAFDPTSKMTKRGARGLITINRKDFGMTIQMPLDAGGVLLGETIPISINAEFVKN